MNNDELKKKIVEILEEGYAPIEYDDGDWGQTYFPTNEDVADALIAAGIGDVKEAEHRVAVAERALRDRATYCAMEGMDYFSLTSVAIEARAKELYKSWRREAEKELAEEGKDD